MSPERRPFGAAPSLSTARTWRQEYWLLNPLHELRPDDGTTDWRLRLDPDNVGVSQGWPERGLPSDATPVDVPGIWNTVHPGYSGIAWYEARIPGPVWPGRSVRIVCGAANYQTDAWLNGAYLGRHEGGYDAFAFRCTDVVRPGENRLTLRIVDPPLDGAVDGLGLRTCPTAKESWYGGHGGPWDVVRLEASAPVWLEDVRVYGDLPGNRATFQVVLAREPGGHTEVDVRARVLELDDEVSSGMPSGRVLGETMRTAYLRSAGGSVSLTVPVRAPRPWSPEQPDRYVWEVSVNPPGGQADPTQVDQTWGWLGFRACELREGVFYLNGEPRFLKGALLQPTFPRTLIRPPDDLWAHDVHIARDAGVNLLRCHLRPPPVGFLDQCDALGVMAYVEPPLAWIEPSGRLLEHGRRELAAMVRMCGNHPSVVMWGIFNENARATEAVGGDLMAELAALDPTRPIIENSGGAAVGEVGMWAWGGQSRCWSPGWEAPRPLNDVHIYLANPLRQEARDLLATVGDGPTLDVTPGRRRAERIESRLSADAVLVSEYGCGALPDFEAALAAFGDEQHLADAVLLRDLRDDLARALAERGLDREIGDLSSLVARTQALQAEGILAQTAALRRNPNVSGIVLTQLADAGWEQMAGLVGLWRHPRPALAAFTRALRPRLLHLETDDPSTTRAFVARLHLIEEASLQRRVYVEAHLHLTARLQPPTEQGRTLDDTRAAPDPVTLQRSSVVVGRRSGGETITLATFAPDEPGRYRLHARLSTEDWEVEASCTILRLPERQPQTGAGLVLLGNGLRRALPEALSELPSGWSGPILAYLPSRPTVSSLRLAVERARAGAHLCLVGLEPPHADQIAALLDLPIRLHGARGNFMGMHHYLRNHPLFAGLGAPCLADGALAEVLPAWTLEEIPSAEILAGCLTVPDGGRAFLWRGSVQTLQYGHGRLTFYQLQASHRQGGALGRYLIDTLSAWLGTRIHRPDV